jgi:hypothetical protein
MKNGKMVRVTPRTIRSRALVERLNQWFEAQGMSLLEWLEKIRASKGSRA